MPGPDRAHEQEHHDRGDAGRVSVAWRPQPLARRE
jgi:hypothetical protein